ncbi:MAG: trimethylamine methyltransferase family protein [Candidatus Poribacteria bacterium]
MAFIPFGIKREPIFSISQLDRIQEAMICILAEIGIRIHQESLREIIRQKGFTFKNDRVIFDNHQILSFLEEERSRNGNAFGQADFVPSFKPLTMDVSPYPQNVHDFDTDKIIPFTSDRLIEATKLVDVLSERGVIASAPGCPTDVPADIQPVKQYWIGATYSRYGKHPVDAKALKPMRYVMEMADVLGHPIKGLPIYVFSPLNLGSESLNCVMEFRDRLDHVGVSDMLSVGCAGPIRLGDTFALASAEVIGSAIIVREITGLSVYWSIRICPFDMRNLSMVLGSPEDFLFMLANSEVNAFFHGTKWWQSTGYTHTTAKLPGAQASAEKASLMTIGAILGARHFSSGGTLSLDEVFSAEQLVIDCDIKDHVQRFVLGLDIDCDPDLCIEEVKKGLDRGFVGLDTTLDYYKKQYWHPFLFERGFLPKWIGDGCPDIRKKSQKMIKELITRHNYQLESDLQKEIDKIYAYAEANV